MATKHHYAMVTMKQTQAPTNLIEIELAIKELPSEDIRQLVSRLQNYLEGEWDTQIESDAQAGKLDTLISEAEADIMAGRTKSLDEVINNA